MAAPELARHVDAVRHFNRFYTRQIGILGQAYLQSPFSLTETRVLYELAHRDRPTATELGRELGLDAGYLSRILRSFVRRGLVARSRSPHDGRQRFLALTARGRKAFAALDARSRDEIGALVGRHGTPARRHLVEAMRTIESVLAAPGLEERRAEPPYQLRAHRPGDMGWVVHRHGVLYAQEYGWDERFEALVARIAADFIDHYDPARERCWIAEREGAIVGSVFLVRKTDDVAKLRLLLVEPAARGLGLGTRLVSECVGFAREAGYHKVTLWTQSILHAARHIYESAGFELVHKEPQHSFGHDLVSETWELVL
jgi:DNA-binding MarR family transcriptional regulator/N-acetylglutamate synthase-like GNAT family acetyltransferase